jgi:hypothetical protein
LSGQKRDLGWISFKPDFSLDCKDPLKSASIGNF